MNHRREDDAARVFHALADPMSLTLILHLLKVGECDSGVGRELEMTPRAAAVRLDRLVAAGLIVPVHRDGRTPLYRPADAAAIERLLATVRHLGAR